MLKIGEFAILSGISIPMLRNYDRLGLLPPSYIDSINGYRYYDKEQLLIANQIVTMKEMGFTLEEIKQSFHQTESGLEQIMKAKIKELKHKEHLIAKQLMLLHKSLEFNHEDNEHLALRIIQKSFATTKALSYSKMIQTFQEEGTVWEEIMELIKRQGIAMNDQALAISRWHERDEEHHNIQAEVLLLQEHIQNVKPPLKVVTFSACEVASIVFKGSYQQLSKINTTLAKWLEGNQYELISNPFTIYHRSPRDEMDESNFLTELCFPIKIK